MSTDVNALKSVAEVHGKELPAIAAVLYRFCDAELKASKEQGFMKTNSLIQRIEDEASVPFEEVMACFRMLASTDPDHRLPRLPRPSL